VKILGIDPGYGILGWAVIASELKVISYGTIQTASGERIDERLLKIQDSLIEIIETHRPDCAAIERLFFSRNTTTALDVAKTMGVILLTLRRNGIDYAEYAPVQVKRAITGYGKAAKEQMQIMIMRIFNIGEIPKPDDAADAIAIAACHALAQR
jgi:crossover junction endodeoxyribonuclease RuvC